MSYSAQQCLDMAKECGRMASQAKDRDARAALIEFARQWLELARHKEQLDRDRAKGGGQGECEPASTRRTQSRVSVSQALETSTDVNQFSQAPGSGDAFDTEAKEFVCLVQMFGTLDLDDTTP